MRRQSVFVRFCIIWPEESLGKGGSRFCQLPGGSICSANVMIPKNISGSSWRETFFSFNGFSYKPESLTFPRIGPAFFLDWGALLRWKLNEKKISMCTVLRFLENCSQTVSKHKSLCFQAFLKKKNWPENESEPRKSDDVIYSTCVRKKELPCFPGNGTDHRRRRSDEEALRVSGTLARKRFSPSSKRI